MPEEGVRIYSTPGVPNNFLFVTLSHMDLVFVGAFSGRIGLPLAVTGWAASCDGGP